METMHQNTISHHIISIFALAAAFGCASETSGSQKFDATSDTPIQRVELRTGSDCFAADPDKIITPASAGIIDGKLLVGFRYSGICGRPVVGACTDGADTNGSYPFWAQLELSLNGGSDDECIDVGDERYGKIEIDLSSLETDALPSVDPEKVYVDLANYDPSPLLLYSATQRYADAARLMGRISSTLFKIEATNDDGYLPGVILGDDYTSSRRPSARQMQAGSQGRILRRIFAEYTGRSEIDFGDNDGDLAIEGFSTRDSAAYLERILAPDFMNLEDSVRWHEAIDLLRESVVGRKYRVFKVNVRGADTAYQSHLIVGRTFDDVLVAIDNPSMASDTDARNE